MFKRWLSAALAVFIFAGTVIIGVSAEKMQVSESISVPDTSSDGRLPFFAECLEGYTLPEGTDDIVVKIEDVGVLLTRVENKQAFLWSEDRKTLSFSFNIQNAGKYCIALDYLNPSENGNDIVRSMTVDGNPLFFEASNIVFRSRWTDNGEITENSLGDQVKPNIVAERVWQHYIIADSGASSPLPFIFEFSSGSHMVEFTYVNNDMAIGDFYVTPYNDIPDYNTVSSSYPDNKKGNKVLSFQAEQSMLYRNSSTIGMTSSTDSQVRPVSDGYRVYNTVGNDSWSQGGTSLTFSFDVPEDGLYKIAVRYRQKWNDGLASYRKIEIDGFVPFSELLAVEFPYSNHWETMTLGNGDEDYLFSMTKGKHTMTMTVVLGEYTEVVHELYDMITLLSDVVLDITMLTGSDADPNYDYQFFRYIPTLEGDFRNLIIGIDECEAKINAIAGKTTSMSSSLKSISYQFNSMVEDPFTIAKRYSQISTAQTTLGTWYSTLQSLPLSIDEFCVAEPSGEIEVRKSNLIENIIGAFKGFLITFVRNYNGVGSTLSDDVEIKETISVWIGQGMEWAEILQEMADTSFTAQTGIQVDLSVVPSGQLNAGNANVLLLSIISGTAPDIALSVAQSSPVEFAIRDAAVELSSFDDFDTVKGQFLDSAFVPFTYNGGIYALPECMTFSGMFYRTDIFKKYDIEVPKTWDELCNNTLQLLAQNGMEFYLPQNFSMFLFQNGGKYYTDNGYYSALDTPEAFASFKQYTEMFTNNGCAVSASFFNRFRSGEMPIGLGDYSLYLQLKTAAPELSGKWSMTNLIGTLQDDGSINISGGGVISTGCVMIAKDSDAKYDDCWEFLKWWTGVKAQQQFSRNVEVMLGIESRWCSANTQAFLSLDWSLEDKKVFEEQWKWVVETPVVLGSAYTSRYITNAFTDCVISGTKSSRDALENAVININKELKYKQEEYGVFTNEE